MYYNRQNGFGINHLITTPNDFLARHRLATEKGDIESEIDPMLKGALTGLLPLLIKGANEIGQTMSYGGLVGNIMPVEVEGREMAELPNGADIMFKGNSHEKGGIDVNLPEGTKVYSKRLKIGGKTMAQRKEMRDMKEMKFMKMLKMNPTDILIRNAMERTMANNKMEDRKDMMFQMSKQKAGNKGIMEDGGLVGGYESLITGGDPNWTEEQLKAINSLKNLLANVGSYRKLSKSNKEELEEIKETLKTESTDKDGNTVRNSNAFIDYLKKDVSIPASVKADFIKDNFLESNSGYSNKDLRQIRRRGRDEDFKYSSLDDIYTNLNNNPKTNPIKEKIKSAKELVSDYVNNSVQNFKHNHFLGKPTTNQTEVVGTGNTNNTKPFNFGNNNAKNPSLTIGDIAGITGTLHNAFSGLANTKQNRAGDIPYTNYYSNYGEKSLGDLENAERNLRSISDRELTGLQRSQQGAYNRNRNNTQSLNVLRGLNIATDSNIEDQKRKIFNNLSQGTNQVNLTRSDLNRDIDRVRADGQKEADTRNIASRDNFYNQKAVGLDNFGRGLQQLGNIFDRAHSRKVLLKHQNQLNLQNEAKLNLTAEQQQYIRKLNLPKHILGLFGLV